MGMISRIAKLYRYYSIKLNRYLHFICCNLAMIRYLILMCLLLNITNQNVYMVILRYQLYMKSTCYHLTYFFEYFHYMLHVCETLFKNHTQTLKIIVILNMLRQINSVT